MPSRLALPARALALLLPLASAPSWAQESGDCASAFPAAESRWAIPKGLLAAIAKVESNQWPWTIDAAGKAKLFSNRAEAENAAQALTAQGLRNVDIGCMQISLLHHPNAFSDITQAFEPAANVDYAARFLASLQRLSGSWEQAVARYHSATPALGEDYRRKVMAAWHGDALTASSWSGYSVETRFGIRVWRPARQPPDPNRHLIIINTGRNE